MVFTGIIVAVVALAFLFWLKAKANMLAKREQP